MEQSYSESDVSLSPTQILERLHMLRQLQVLQQGKLHKQRLQYEESSQSSTITEIVSQFSNSTSFNTFRSLLESPRETSNDSTPRLHPGIKSPQVKPQDLIDGVSVLNLSQESEFIVNSPVSSMSKISSTSTAPKINEHAPTKNLGVPGLSNKKQISLDDMPILSPRKDFEALIIEKLKNELDAPKGKILEKKNDLPGNGKRPFLKRGEGMTRFGIKKNDLVIQSTQDLPWKQRSSNKSVVGAKPNQPNKKNNVDVQIIVTEPKALTKEEARVSPKSKQAPNHASEKSPVNKLTPKNKPKENEIQTNTSSVDNSKCEIHAPKPVFLVPQMSKETRLQVPKGKHPLLSNKGKTWAAVFTKEQDDFLRQLKQSDYYKNFTSPAKSIVSDISCDENLLRLRQDRELAEQNMFELLENKANHESFNVDNSFVYRFLKGNNLESSGESTPLILQKCLSNNPELKRIFAESQRMRNESLQSEEICNSECTDCCNDTCTSVSDCCSCNTADQTANSERDNKKQNKKTYYQKGQGTIENNKKKEVEQLPIEPDNDKTDKTENDNDTMKANLAEMNAKLIATSELLKDRLRELEDEIETFRKENANLTKMREEIETEKHKFFEEKAAFEQKFNEEKILSEYYLAEEKEKLSKQKQIYDRQVREMRGRLNKKEKDEVINLKKEINDLKEEIKLKDAKSTTIVARLRNQLKIMEKEKKDLQDEIEKLKKENRRIQHSSDISQRLTNMKYLDEVNKKLKNLNTKSARVEQQDENVKHKAVSTERQSRSKRVAPTTAHNPLRTRAKSVPNLNVTSRYAKYFSQRDVLSPTERNQILNIDTCPSEDGDNQFCHEIESSNDTESIQDISDHENENSLEKIYMERFQDTSKESAQSEVIDRLSHRGSRSNIERINEYSEGFFIRRSNSNSSSTRNSKSPKQLSPHYQPSGSGSNRCKSPVSILSNKSSSRRSPVTIIRENEKPEYLSTQTRSNNSHSRSRSPVSILSNHTYSSQRQPTVINRTQFDNKLSVSPEPSSKTSFAKTDLKPMEIRKPDGSRELRFPNGNVKHLSADGKYSKFIYYNGDVKENFYNEGRIKYYYAETKTVHITHPDGLEVLEFPDGQVEKRYPDNSSEIRLPNGSVRYHDPKSEHVREEWRFPDGAVLTVASDGSRRVVFPNGQVEVHTEDHKRREFPDGTVKLVYSDGTAETRYASGRVRIKDKHGNLIMDSVPR